MKLQCGEQSWEHTACPGETLLDVIRSFGLPFAAPCSGKGTCGKCRVMVREGANNAGSGSVGGSAASDTGNTSGNSATSGTDSACEKPPPSRWTLACQTEATNDLLVELASGTEALPVELLCAVEVGSRFGVAIDLGTTTMAAELVNLESGEVVARVSRMNPQLLYGADVISRIEAAGTGKLDTLRVLVQSALSELIHALCRAAALPRSTLCTIVLAGNTVMQHLAAGHSPASIGVAPYEPLSLFGEYLSLWQDLPPVWFAPCISGYVGGDIAAGMLSASAPLPSLLIDLGTNGELALKTGTGSFAAATAAGPVFEGMNICCGMPALPGAVSRVHPEENTGKLLVEVVGGGKAQGICGSGLIDLVALMLEEGLVDESGRILSADECCATGEKTPHTGEQSARKRQLAECITVHQDAPALKLPPAPHLFITQQDIRNVQLAKAALASGIEVLLESAGLLPDSLESLILTGNFGQHLTLAPAARLGLLPTSLLNKASSRDNMALAGARKALLSSAARRRMRELAQSTHYIELSTSAPFSQAFIRNLGF